MSQSAALFGRVTQAQPRHLLQFKAGKLTMDAENWVRADSRKGWAYVYLSSDSKLHFCWIEKKSGFVEDDFIISTKDAEFKRVTQCSTGRVYVLKLKGPQRFFIWMQETNEANDNDICSRINEFIKSPPTQSTTSSSDWIGGLGGLSQLSQNELLTLLSMGVNIGSGLSSESDISSVQATIGRHAAADHQAATRDPGITTTTVTSSAAAASNANAGASATSKSGKIQLNDLHNILSSLSGPSKPTARVDLNDAVNVEAVRGLLGKPEVRERLLPHLPPTVEDPAVPPEDDTSRLTTNIRSSQFKSTLKSFSDAFQTGELAPVLAQFNLGSKANEAAKRGDLVAFSHALQGDSGSATGQPSTPSVVESATVSSPAENASKKPKRDDEDDKDKPKKGGEDGASGPTAMDTD